MAHKPDKAIAAENQFDSIPTYLVNLEAARQAFEAHSAIILAELRSTELSQNPFWTMLRQDAYERFALAFQTAGGDV